MIYLLDTNTCIQYLNGRSQSVRQRLESLNPEDMVLCSMVKAELYYGAMKSTVPERTLSKLQVFVERFESLPFDNGAATVYGRIRAQLERGGTPIGPNDLIIAAIAVAHDVTLVTHNTREFSRVDGLKLEDWQV